MKIPHLSVKFNPLISSSRPLKMRNRSSRVEAFHERYSRIRRSAGREGGAAGVAGGAVGGAAGSGGAGGRAVYAAEGDGPRSDTSGGAASARGDWAGGCDSLLHRGADEEGLHAVSGGAAVVSAGADRGHD